MILANGAQSVTLSDDLQWVDRFTQTALSASVARGITGKPLFTESLKVAGVSVSLRQPAPNMAVTPLATVRTVQAWAGIPGLVMAWTYAGQTYSVRFAPDPVKKAQPLIGLTYNEDGELWNFELDLITVA